MSVIDVGGALLSRAVEAVETVQQHSFTRVYLWYLKSPHGTDLGHAEARRKVSMVEEWERTSWLSSTRVEKT